MLVWLFVELVVLFHNTKKNYKKSITFRRLQHNDIHVHTGLEAGMYAILLDSAEQLASVYICNDENSTTYKPLQVDREERPETLRHCFKQVPL